MTMSIENFIYGEKVEPLTGEYMALTNPHKKNDSPGRVALSGSKDVDQAVEAARKALPLWSMLQYRQRVSYLYKLHTVLQREKENLANLINLESGKNLTEAAADVEKSIEVLEFAISSQANLKSRKEAVGEGVTCEENFKPLGVCAAIVPFNFPMMVPFWTLPNCLVTGNTLIIKPSEKVPRTLNLICDLFNEIELPPGVVNVVNGTKDVVEALCDHPKISGISFVGSTPVGRIVYNRAIVTGKKVLCLTGAKNHLIGLPDCDVEMTATDITNSYTGCAGQRCMAASVLHIVKQQPELLDRLVELAMSKLPGKGPRDLGPVISEEALLRMKRYIDQAEKEGCQILVDGRTWMEKYPEGYFFGPTIIICDSHKNPCAQEEIFGPILTIVYSRDFEHSIEMENDSKFGNAASIYTSTAKHANWFTQRFSAGMLGVNIGVPVPREPFSFGGLDGSLSKFGFGDLTGEDGLRFWTKKIKVTMKWVPPKNRTWMD